MFSPIGLDIDDWMQKRRNSIANAIELRLFCIKPSICEMLASWKSICSLSFLYVIPAAPVIGFLAFTILPIGRAILSLAVSEDEHGRSWASVLKLKQKFVALQYDDANYHWIIPWLAVKSLLKQPRPYFSETKY